MERHSRSGDAAAPRRRVGRVLVVEDERDVAELIRYHLSKGGYEIQLVFDGAGVFNHVREFRPDAVLLDLMIPQLNGWEVCRRLKQDSETRMIPVIMVTGRAEEGDKILGFELGADDYITKPFSPRELLVRVRAVIRRGQLGRSEEKKHHLKVGDLEIDRRRFQVTMRGRPVGLTRKHLARLRAKFVEAKLPAPGIESVRGVGYRFRESTKANI